MTEKRFQWIYIKDNMLELKDNGIVKAFNNERLEELLNELVDENEQLEQDNNVLIQLLENQSIIIQELSSKISEYQLKEPIILTKEDIEIMDKAISYYTHGRCGE